VSGSTRALLYDEVNLVQELSGGTPSINYLTGANIDETFTATTGAGSQNYMTDIVGSTVALASSAGAIQTGYSYDAYGNVTSTGSTSSNKLQYTGRDNDGTGLYYYRARYYSPQWGRFISGDPIGLGGGINEYAYVRGNAISRRDPLGLLDNPAEIANLYSMSPPWNGDVFLLGSITGGPDLPVRFEGEGVALGGYSSSEGWYGGVLGAGGVEVGGVQNYAGYFIGAESTTQCRSPRKITLKELSFGPEIPFLAGIGMGGGRYVMSDESGYFFFLGGGAIGEHGALGFGFSTWVHPGGDCGCQ
jgi:RHS repeat-associated protein